MHDIEAKELLGKVLVQAPPVAIQGLQAVALLISNYGYLANTDTFHWLGYPVPVAPSGDFLQVKGGYFPIYDNPMDGISIFCQTLLSRLGRDVLMSGDIGQLAWALLVHKIVPMEPTKLHWKIVRTGLDQAFQRLAPVYGNSTLWHKTKFVPPIVRKEWTHRAAFEDLRTKMHPNTPSSVLLGLLAWASVSSNYGMVNGHPTCNWGLVGHPGRHPEHGHVLDESGTFLVQVMEPEEGIQTFLQKIVPVGQVFESEDIGALSLAMLQNRALGIDIQDNEESWMNMCKEIRIAMDAIAAETGLPMTWAIKSLHPSKEQKLKKEAAVLQEESNQPVEKPKRKIWPWVLGGGALLAGGYFVWKYMRSDVENLDTTPVTAKELLDKKVHELPSET